MINDWLQSIPGGDIQLRDDRKDEVWSAHLEPFLLSRFPVTQKLWLTVMPDNPSTFVGDNRPVEGVSWFDAVQFCNTLSDNAGLDRCYSIAGESVAWNTEASGYRLPTDAEWEYACRANERKVQYGPIEDIAWFSGNANDETHDVGMNTANNFGLHDMLGNVWEWCWDVYDPEVYGSYRIFRGGGWADESRGCLASNRRRSHPTYTVDDLGFRIARSTTGPVTGGA